MALINKKQAGELLGLSKQRMSDQVHTYRALGWPQPVYKERNVQYFNDYEIVAWYERVKAAKLAPKVIPDKPQGLNNRMAMNFICAR